MSGPARDAPAPGEPVFEVCIETSFEAAHRRDAGGDEVPLHHHLWELEARARARRLDPIGVVIDFRRLRAAADDVVAELDQRVLEDLPPFGDTAATAAAVAAWVFRHLGAAVDSERCWLHSVTVEADPGVRVVHAGGPRGSGTG